MTAGALLLDRLRLLDTTQPTTGIVKGTGKEIALALAKNSFEGILVIHSKNEAEAQAMAQHLPQASSPDSGSLR